MRIIFYMLFFILNCSGPALFQQSEQEGAYVSLDANAPEEGVVVAEVSASAAVSQLLSIAGDEALSGTTLTIPPGSLVVDTAITMEQGVSLINDTFLSEIGFSGAGELSTGSQSLLVESQTPVNPVGSLAISLPLSGQALKLSDLTNYSVVYAAYDYKNKRTLAGAIPSSKISVRNNIARFNVNYFGMYQVVKTEKEVKNEISVASNVELNSQREVAKMKQLSLPQPSVQFDTNERQLVIYFPDIDTSIIKSCRYSVDDDETYPSLHTGEITSRVMRIDEDRFKVRSFFVFYECQDRDGRILVSLRSNYFTIPQKSAEPQTTKEVEVSEEVVSPDPGSNQPAETLENITSEIESSDNLTGNSADGAANAPNLEEIIGQVSTNGNGSLEVSVISDGISADGSTSEAGNSDASLQDLSDNLIEGSPPLADNQTLDDGSVLYSGFSLARGQRMVIDESMSEIVKPWFADLGDQYVIGVLRENASAPFDRDDFEFAVEYEKVESDNSDDSHEIRVSAFDSNAGVQNSSAFEGAFSYAAIEVSSDGSDVWLILDSSGVDIENKVARIQDDILSSNNDFFISPSDTNNYGDQPRKIYIASFGREAPIPIDTNNQITGIKVVTAPFEADTDSDGILDSEDDDDDNDGVLDVEEIAAGSDPLVAEP